MMDDTFMLDTYYTVYVWIGPESNEYEKKHSFEIVRLTVAIQASSCLISFKALEYVKEASEHDGRDSDTPVVVTYAGTPSHELCIKFKKHL